MAKKKSSNGKTQPKPKSFLNIPVEYGGVSIGKATLRLGITIDRSKLNIVAADEAFCGHRLSGKVLLGGSDDAEGQGYLFEDEEFDGSVSGSFDVKSIGVSASHIKTGLTFSLADVDVGSIAKFSKGSGRLLVEAISEIPADAPNEDHEDMDEDSESLKAEGPWADVGLDELFSGAIREALHNADIDTVGELHNWTASKKRLQDIKGIGPGKATQIEDRMLKFWSDNPQYCDGKEGAVPEEAEA